MTFVKVLLGVFLGFTGVAVPSLGPPVALATASAAASSTVTIPGSCDGSSGTLVSNGYPFTTGAFGSYCRDNYIEWSTNKAQRTFVSFDTSAIPASATILSASISVFPGGDIQDDGGSALELVSASQGATLTAEDWRAVGSTSFSSIRLSDLKLLRMNTIPLNLAGLSSIQRGGISQFAFRLGLDLLAQPPIGNNYAQIVLEQGPYGITLSVTYRVVPGLQIQLSPGWNLISTPISLQDGSLGAVFAESPEVNEVYSWQNGAWSYAMRSAGAWDGNLTQMATGNGYWVYATAAATITLHPSGIQIPSSLSLPRGWNMIGYTSPVPSTPISSYLSSIQGKWTIIYRFDPMDGWELARSTEGFTDMEQGRGYWIYLTEPGTVSG